MGLEKYHQKRNFNSTPEPKGGVGKENSTQFFVQKHAASRLHYDFRIELDGVLKSWAVPKGPALDPAVKRLAIQVEDHPLEYGTFEGIIPKGEYGGGTVLLWDKGIWESLDKNPVKAYHKGHLRFLLHAEKLKGRWDLFRFQSKDSEKNHWFLVKYDDKYARVLKQYDITKKKPKSVLSGKSIAQIAEHYKAVWTSGGVKKEDSQKKTKTKFKKVALDRATSPFPDFIKPQLATLVDEAPNGDEWAHEIKFDGYRLLAFKQGTNVKLLSRNNKNWTKSFKNVAGELQKLPLENVVLDGEMVVLDEKSRTSFQRLQNSIKTNQSAFFIYYVFDVLYYDQWDVRSLKLVERKKLLEPLLQNSAPAIRYSDHVIGQGKAFFEKSCQFVLEGIISKKLDGKYISKRTKSWLKIKCLKRQEFVIAGYSKPQGSRNYFGSLYLGAYDAQNNFVYCGKVGTGFDQKTLKNIYLKLSPLVTDTNPFNVQPPGSSTATWVKPKLVAEVQFTEWTDDGRLRHPSFKGLREDKNAVQVHKELEMPVKKIKASKNVKPSKKEENKVKVNFTHLDKVLYPEDNITKRDLCEYYSEVAPFILPFIKNRPLSLLRCPDNYHDCFYQKHMNVSTAKTLLSVPIKSKKNKKKENYLYLDGKEGLLGLVQMGVLEIHPWGSSIADIALPDMITFDLDPSPELPWKEIVRTAFVIKKNLEELRLQSFVKQTGGKGLHVVVPIKPNYDWDIVKKFAKLFVEFLEKQNPESYVTTISKSKRKGKIFLDYLRNQLNATAISVYSTRARQGAPVATPLHWDELTSNINDTFYTIHTLTKRLKHLKNDPWEDFWTINQELKI